MSLSTKQNKLPEHFVDFELNISTLGTKNFRIMAVVYLDRL